MWIHLWIPRFKVPRHFLCLFSSSKLLCFSKGRNLYEKNVAPLLHLAGLEVTLVKVCDRWLYLGTSAVLLMVCGVTDICIIELCDLVN